MMTWIAAIMSLIQLLNKVLPDPAQSHTQKALDFLQGYAERKKAREDETNFPPPPPAA